jgi:peptidyl-prolyl cis-trans isomerase C
MKSLLTVILIISLLGLSQLASTDQSEAQLDIFAQRGEGVVTQDEFNARAASIPDKHRLGVIRDRNRLRELLANMLLNSQLASDAREAGYETDTVVIERMKLAAETELAKAWLQHYIASFPAADFEALALDYYRLHQGEMLSLAKIDVTHILVSNKERSYEEALVLANSIRGQVIENPAAFSELALKYSEDSSVSSNMGSFKGVKRGDMVPPFENKAFSLKPGEISEPVKTQYGYHIIRLDAVIAPEQLPFEEVKQKLVDIERQAHEDRIKADYISRLSSLEVEITPESLQEMVRRQFGEDYVDPYTNNEKLE